MANGSKKGGGGIGRGTTAALAAIGGALIGGFIFQRAFAEEPPIIPPPNGNGNGEPEPELQIEFDNLSDGDEVSGSLSVVIEPNDPLLVDHINLYLNNFSEFLGRVDDPPYEFTVPTEQFADDEHNLIAVAVGIDGHVILKSIRIVFENVPDFEVLPDATSLYLPLYSEGMREVSEIYNPQLAGFANLFTANPHSGPFEDGTKINFATPENRSEVYDNAVLLKQQNPQCRVLGYIATGNSTQQTNPWKSIAGLKLQINAWAAWNIPEGEPGHVGGQPGTIDGVMFDEADAPDTQDAYDFYEEITEYARDSGLNFVRGNPGREIENEGLVDLFDVITFSEGSTLLDEAEMQRRTFFGAYPKEKFNYLAHTIPESQFSDEWFLMALNYCSSIYVTDDVGGQENPWNNPSSYLQRQVDLLFGAGTVEPQQN